MTETLIWICFALKKLQKKNTLAQLKKFPITALAAQNSKIHVIIHTCIPTVYKTGVRTSGVYILFYLADVVKEQKTAREQIFCSLLMSWLLHLYIG